MTTVRNAAGNPGIMAPGASTRAEDTVGTSREQTLCIDGELRLVRRAGGERHALRWTVTRESLATARLKNEFALRPSLSGAWAVMPVGLVGAGASAELLLHDPGAPLLEAALGAPWSLDAFFDGAIALVSAVAAMHGSGVLHRDLLPDRIFYDATRRLVWLAGFGVAVRAARATPAADDTLSLYRASHLAPEQTGRLHRPVDRRADLYSVGVIFHRMLTGELPFAGHSARDMAHAHVALEPVRASDANPAVPTAVARIVATLLSKPVDDRYPTAASLLADLRFAQAAWAQHGEVPAFAPARAERSRRPVIAADLFGRDRELATLESAVDRVTGGPAELVTVAGYSGAGKSSLVQSLEHRHRPCRFVSGKADELGRLVPFAALKRALAGLADAPPPDVDLVAALGEYSGVLAHLEPSLERLVGVAVDALGGSAGEAEVRVREGVRRLLLAFARDDVPLVLFIDDLQWVDPATLSLLRQLLADVSLRNVLVAGAFRSEDVGPDHPVTAWLDAVSAADVPVTELVLAPLDRPAMAALVADALQAGRADVAPLADRVHQHTIGNPFFAIQYLAELAEDGLLVDDEDVGAWRWDDAALAAATRGPGLLHLMLGKLDRLPVATRALLARLACLGNRTTLATLQQVSGLDDAGLRRALWPATLRGLIVASAHDVRFAHDRVLEAMYASIPARRRPRLHLAVGLRLLAAAATPLPADTVFAVVHQLDLGRDVLRRADHRAALAALNLQAARVARDQTACSSALGFAETGLALLEPAHPDAFELQLLCAECHVLLRDDEHASRRLAALLPAARDALDRARVARLQGVLHVVRSEYAQAVAVAIGALRDFGVALDPHPPRADVRSRCERVLARLDALPAGALVDADRTQDAGAESAMALLAEMFAPACFTDESLAILHLCHMVELTLDHGLTAGSPHGLAWFGIMVGHHFGRHRDAHRLALLARDLVLRRGFAAYEAKSLFALEITEVWVRPLDQAIATSRAAYRVAVDRGDLAVACFACNHTVNDLLVRGEPLEAVAEEIERSLAIVRRAGYKDVVDELVAQQRLVMALRGQTDTAASFDGPGFSSAAFEQAWTPERMPTMVFWYWVLRAQLSFIAGDAARARADLDTAAQWLWSSPVHVQYASFHLFSALALAADGAGPPPLERIDAHLAQLRVWERVNPATFADKVALVAAEAARVRGDTAAAAVGYERAAQLAAGAGAWHVEAMASECAARFHAGLGLSTSAGAWWVRARQAYAAWGADAKVRAIDALVSAGDGTVVAKDTRAGHELLELAVVRRVSEAIVGEVDIDALVRTLMVTAIEHAGAQRALLLLPHDGGMRTRASAVTGHDGIQVSARRDAPSAADLPLGLLDEVCRRHKQVLIDDAARSGVHAADPYMVESRPRSVLCMPLLKHGRLVAVLYLENRLTPHVFSPDRVALLGLIATQSAIALENAALYSDLVRENQDRQHAEADARRARDALEESESRFRQMAEATPDVIWITDVHPEKVLYTNPSFERIWGRTVQALYDDPRVWVEGIHPDDRAAVGELFSGWIAAAEGPWQADFRVMRPDGSIRRVLDRGFATKDAAGRVVRVSGLATDVTDRYAAEVALKESEERFALAVAGANDGIWDWDLTTQRIFMSDRAQKVYGMPPGPEVRSYGEWMAGLRMHPEDAEARERLLADYLEGRCDTYDAEWRVHPHEGPWRWIRVRGVCVRDASGRPTRMAGSVSDIDARRRSEGALRQAQRLEAVGTLASGIAHDFNNILGAILGFGESALQRTRAGTRLRRDLECILTGGERGKALVEQVLLFSRSGIAERMPVHVQAVVVECLGLVAGNLPADVTIRSDLNAGAAAMLGDATQIHQVVMNLATNGVQSMPGGGRLTVTLSTDVLETSRLVVTAALPPGPYVVLRVEDTGTGIEPEIRARIFDPFFTTKDVGAGTGLGLSLVHGIVSELGGGIDVQSVAGQGSVFTVWLPRAGDVPGEPVPVQPPAPGRATGRSVLVLDDDLTLLQWTSQALADAGYEASSFSSPDAALEAFRARPGAFDLVLSDERMPRLTGTQFIASLREVDTAVPVILISGFLDAGLQLRAAEAGASLVLGKPVSASQLTGAVATLLKGRAGAPRRRPAAKKGTNGKRADQPPERSPL